VKLRRVARIAGVGLAGAAAVAVAAFGYHHLGNTTEGSNDSRSPWPKLKQERHGSFSPLLSSPTPKSKVLSHALPHAALLTYTTIYRGEQAGKLSFS
jgi:hypothetical protein